MDSQPVKDIEAALRDMEVLAKGSGENSGAGQRSYNKEKPRNVGKRQKVEKNGLGNEEIQLRGCLGHFSAWLF